MMGRHFFTQCSIPKDIFEVFFDGPEVRAVRKNPFFGDAAPSWQTPTGNDPLAEGP
jgi:hypothetical protein